MKSLVLIDRNGPHVCVPFWFNTLTNRRMNSLTYWPRLAYLKISTIQLVFFQPEQCFLSQQFSQNSVFQPIQPSFSKPNGTIVKYTATYHCIKKGILIFFSHKQKQYVT